MGTRNRFASIAGVSLANAIASDLMYHDAT